MAFISFEGIDGCGKTTQIKLLRAHLEARGATIFATREPGGAVLSEAIRDLVLQTRAANTQSTNTQVASTRARESAADITPRAELLLFAAARAQHVEEKIRPALLRGEIVLCDRFTDSTEAYQGGGLKLSTENIAWLNAFATSGLFPDITFWLDLSPREGVARRAKSRGEADRIEERGLHFQEEVRAAFARIAARDTKRVVRIDAEKTVEEIHADIARVLATRFSAVGFQFSETTAQPTETRTADDEQAKHSGCEYSRAVSEN